jgi:hypothetical protein
LWARLARRWGDWFARGGWWLSGIAWKTRSTGLAVLTGLASWASWTWWTRQTAAVALRVGCRVDDRGGSVAVSLTTGAVVGHVLWDRLEVVYF